MSQAPNGPPKRPVDAYDVSWLRACRGEHQACNDNGCQAQGALCGARPEHGHPSAVFPGATWTATVTTQTCGWAARVGKDEVIVGAEDDGSRAAGAPLWNACWVEPHAEVVVEAGGDTLDTCLRELARRYLKHQAGVLRNALKAFQAILK